MSDYNKTGGPAFPSEHVIHEAGNVGNAVDIKEHSPGMTLRDYFAGQALAGIMANPVRWQQIADDYRSGKKTYEQCSKANAVKAYSIADAMLTARNSQ